MEVIISIGPLRTPPSARHAATHGVTVDVSLIRIRPTTGSLTSPCSSSDPRGQRGCDRRDDQGARHMLERDEIGVAAPLLRRRGRRAASPLALEAVCLVRPTTPAAHHRQRRRSCNAAPRGDGQGSATSAGNEAPAAARGPLGPRAVRRSWPEMREVAVSGGRGRAMGPRWAQLGSAWPRALRKGAILAFKPHGGL